MGRHWPVLFAFLSGALLPLAFAPTALYPIAILSPALLFWIWQGTSPHEAAWRGFYFGLGLFGIGVSWVYVAIHDFGYTSALLAAVLTALFVAFLALYLALQGWLSVYLLRCYGEGAWHSRLPGWLWLWPALWVLFEWLRGWTFSGFPWLNLGYSQIDSPLAGLAPWLGIYGLSWAVVSSAALLLAMWRLRGSIRFALGGLLLGLWGLAWGLGQVEWTTPVDTPVRVSLIQGNQPQITKWDAAQIQARLDHYATATRAHWDSDLVVWPENALTVFYHEIADEYLLPLAAEAVRQQTDLILGLPVMDLATERYYSSMMSLGKTPGVYHKRHLVPFGEYVPLASLLRGLIGFFDLPMSDFSRGTADQAPLQAAGQTFAPTICYEDAFGEELIRFLPAASLLVNGSNNAWYGNSLAPHQHLQIARMRARETGRDLLRATTNGISALIDYRGRILAASPQFKSDVLRGQVQPRQGATPYVRFGNWPVLIGVFLVLGIFILLYLRQKRGERRGARDEEAVIDEKSSPEEY